MFSYRSYQKCSLENMISIRKLSFRLKYSSPNSYELLEKACNCQNRIGLIHHFSKLSAWKKVKKLWKGANWHLCWQASKSRFAGPDATRVNMVPNTETQNTHSDWRRSLISLTAVMAVFTKKRNSRITCLSDWRWKIEGVDLFIWYHCSGKLIERYS